MTTPLEVDVTGWVIARLDTALTARVGSDTPADLAAQLPFVRPVRVGGGDDNMAIDSARMVFHCFAATEQAANQLGYQVRGAIRDLRGTAADGAVLTHSRKTGGPALVPSDNAAVRHAVLTMDLDIKTT